jgi:hypothetical protein
MDTRIKKENLEGCMGEISEPSLWGRYPFEKQAAASILGVFSSNFRSCYVTHERRDK